MSEKTSTSSQKFTNTTPAYTFKIPDVSTFTKEQKIAFDQMIDFLADMIEKYGDKIPKDKSETIKTPNKKTA